MDEDEDTEPDVERGSVVTDRTGDRSTSAAHEGAIDEHRGDPDPIPSERGSGAEPSTDGPSVTGRGAGPIDRPSPAGPIDPSGDTGAATDQDRDAGGHGRTAPGDDHAIDVDVDGGSADEDAVGLFDDLLSGDAVFETKEVLRPAYTPRRLPHRTEQITDIATILVSALRGETPSNVLVYGKTGTGKTASARFVSQELQQTSGEYAVPCQVEYINCEVTDTRYRVLARLANTFLEDNRERAAAERETLAELVAAGDREALSARGYDSVPAARRRIDELAADAEAHEPVPMTGWPTDRVYRTFFEAVDRYERVVVVMLDEIDRLVEKSGDDTLYNLSRMNSGLENSRVSIIGISNDLTFTEFLDPRVKSSLGEEEVVFPPYDAEQLTDILEQRAAVAFRSGVLDDDVIPLCAAFAAQEHGDARRALDLLRTAGELAERARSSVVTGAHVRQAQERIELDRIVEAVGTLPRQSKLVLLSVVRLAERGERNSNTGEVYNEYRRLCRATGGDVLTQRRVTDLIGELDMLGIVTAVVVSKGRYGRTREIDLSVPIQETRAVLTSDAGLAGVGDD